MPRFKKYLNAIMCNIQEKPIFLKQKDFQKGTYRITKPGHYILKEDIHFEPNSDYDFMPRPDQPEYSGKAYRFGFFAAITIESPQVILDLNGHSIQQTAVHALQQRFYSHIELANTPFLEGQGPADFGPLKHSAVHTIIQNGKLERSSHHAIHGNRVKGVAMYNLKITDFEIAGIAVNGFHNLHIERVQIGPNRRDTPVNSKYSAGRFLHLLGRAWLKLHPEAEQFAVLLTALEHELDVVLKYIQSGDTLPEGNFFRMPFTGKEQISDGGIYGIVAHTPGVAVNDFLDRTYDGPFAEKLYLKKIRIHDLAANVTEVVTLSQKDGTGVISDPSGSVFRLKDVLNDGRYQGNLLSDVQLAAAKAGFEFGETIGRTNITKDVIEWAEQGQDISNLEEKGYRIVCNSDSMFHVAKGVHGIRIDGTVGGQLKDIRITNLLNTGCLGDTSAGAYKLSQTPQKRPGYRGADITGLSIACSEKIGGDQIYIENIQAWNGCARGIRYLNENRKIHLENTTIRKVIAGYKEKEGIWYGISTDHEEILYNSSLPNLIPIAFGIVIEALQEEFSTAIYHTHLQIEDVRGVGCGFPYAYMQVTV